jgi:hypothetical protein
MEVMIVVLLVAVVASLGHALTSMSAGAERAGAVRSSVERSHRMAQALTLRISLSIALFALMLLGYHFGWIQPHSMH